MRSYIPSIFVYESKKTDHIVKRLFARFRVTLAVDASAVPDVDEELGLEILNSIKHAIIMKAKYEIANPPDTDYADISLGRVIVRVHGNKYPVTLYVPKDMDNPPEPPEPGKAPSNEDLYYSGNEVSIIYRPDEKTGEGTFMTVLVSYVANRSPRRSIPADPLLVDVESVAKTQLPKDLGVKELVLVPGSVLRTKPDGPVKSLKDYDYADRQLALYFDDGTRKVISEGQWISFKSSMIRQAIWVVINNLFTGITKDQIMFAGKVTEWGLYDSPGKPRYEYESSMGKTKKPAPFLRIKIDDVVTVNGESARQKLQALGEGLWEKFENMLCS